MEVFERSIGHERKYKKIKWKDVQRGIFISQYRDAFEKV